MQIFPRFFCFSTFRVLQTVFHLCIYVYMNRLLLHQFFLIHAMRHKQYIPLNILCCRVPVVYLPVRERYDIHRIARCYLHLPILSLPLHFVKCFPLSHFHGSQQLFQWALLIPRLSYQVRFRILHSAPIAELVGFGSWVILSVTSYSALCNYNITRFVFCQQSP